MAWVLVVEDQTPHQTAIEARLGLVFPPGPGRPASLTPKVAQTAARALQMLGLDTDLARVNVPDAWEHLPQRLRDELSLRTVPPELYGVTCDLELRSAPAKELTAEVGVNLVKLLSHWRHKQRANFRLVVVSQFADTHRDRLEPFCDRLLLKVDKLPDAPGPEEGA
jgi:hypothetical protein